MRNKSYLKRDIQIEFYAKITWRIIRNKIEEENLNENRKQSIY